MKELAPERERANPSELDELNRLSTELNNAKDFSALELIYQSVQDHSLYANGNKELKEAIDKLYNSCGLNFIINLFSESSDLFTLETKYQIVKLSSFYAKNKKPISTEDFTSSKEEIDGYYAYYRNRLLFDPEVKCLQCGNISRFLSKELSNKNVGYCKNKRCDSSSVNPISFLCSGCHEVFGKFKSHTCPIKEAKKSQQEDFSKRISWRNTNW